MYTFYLWHLEDEFQTLEFLLEFSECYVGREIQRKQIHQWDKLIVFYLLFNFQSKNFIENSHLFNCNITRPFAIKIMEKKKENWTVHIFGTKKYQRKLLISWNSLSQQLQYSRLTGTYRVYWLRNQEITDFLSGVFWRFSLKLTIFFRNFWRWVIKFDTLMQRIELSIVLIRKIKMKYGAYK